MAGPALLAYGGRIVALWGITTDMMHLHRTSSRQATSPLPPHITDRDCGRAAVSAADVACVAMLVPPRRIELVDDFFALLSNALALSLKAQYFRHSL